MHTRGGSEPAVFALGRSGGALFLF